MAMLRFLRPALLALALVAAQVGHALAQREVDLELVLAVDVSWSMDPDEQRLQRDGYADSFRDPAILKAIKAGAHGRIAVAYIEWAGPDIHSVVIPWTLIEDARSINAFADELAKRPISRLRMTSISSALLFSARQFSGSPYRGARRVIDVSGDGPNNSGPSPVSRIRDEIVKQGIVINGLPIMLKVGNVPGGFNWGQDLADLDTYYADCVIGGPGSFMIPIRERHEFLTATRQKLLQEISGLTPPRLLHRAQYLPGTSERGAGGNGRTDCEIGEKMWRRDYPGMGRF